MVAIRVTQGMMTRRTLNDLNDQTRRLFTLQEQLATGLRVNNPSDDPLAARRAVNIRAVIGKSEQYLTNISNSSPQLTETTNSLQTVVNILQRAHELTVQGASQTNSQEQCRLLGIEVNQLLESMLAEANHQTNGRYIFAGSRTSDAPFVATRDTDGQITAVTYQGNQETIDIPVADGIAVTINENGLDAFMDTQDLFQTLIGIRDDLYAANQTSLQETRLAELDRGQDQVLVSLARVGATQNRLERMDANTEDYVQQLRAALSDNIDADYAETVINLDAQTNAFRAALSAASRVIQPSLLDYLS